MKTLLTLSLTLIFSNLFSQNNFQRLYGGINHERGQTVFETFNNYFIVNGATTSYGQGIADGMLIKTDNAGNTIWSKVYGMTDYDNSELALESYDRGYICAGRSTVAIGSGTNDAWIFKTDSAGVLQWSKAFGSSASNDGFIQGVITSDSGYAFVGYTRSAIGAGSDDIFFVRTNANGDTVFSRSYGTAEIEVGASVIQSSDGGFVICGRRVKLINGDIQSDGLILKTDSAGNMLWSKLYGDTLWEEFQSILELETGGYAIAGSTVSLGAGGYDILYMTTDTAGNPLLTFTYGGQKADAAYHLVQDIFSTFIIAGYTESFGHGHSFAGSDSTNIFLLRIQETGQFLFMQTYGDGLQDEAFRCGRSTDGGYMITGLTTNYNFSDSTQTLFIKTDVDGSSGCHEFPAFPIMNSGTMPVVVSGFLEVAGTSVTSPNIIETTITTVNNDACLFASIEDRDVNHKISAYPVPFTNDLTINIATKNCDLAIYDSNGRIVFRDQKYSGESIQTNEWSSGLYFISVISDESVEVLKAVK